MEKWKKQLEEQLDFYLTQQQFNINDADKYSLLKKRALKALDANISFFKVSVLFSFLILVAVYNWSENINLKIGAIILAIATLGKSLIEVRRSSLFNEKSLNQFSCPKCSQKVCWFFKESFDTDKEYYTKHKRVEEVDSKGGLHIVYRPIDYVKYKHHTIYHCDKCHHEKDEITIHNLPAEELLGGNTALKESNISIFDLVISCVCYSFIIGFGYLLLRFVIVIWEIFN